MPGSRELVSKARGVLVFPSVLAAGLGIGEGWTAGVDASVAVVKAGANGDVDLNTATQPANVFVMTNQGLIANLTIEGTQIGKLKTQ